MSSQQISRRHHYLPEFLLKGFVGNDGRMFVYDKKTKRFWKEAVSPKQIFWRHNQNTFKIGDEETDFVEQIYSKVDGDFAPLYAKILKTPGPVNLTAQEVAELVSFVSVSFYRVPVNDEFIRQFVLNNSPKKLGFRVYDPKTDKDVSDDVYKVIMQEPAFIESYRVSKGIMEMLSYSKQIKTDDWNIAAPAELNGFGLIGDNPVILREPFSGYFLIHNMIMPLSKHHIVYHNTGNKPENLPPEHKFTVDLFQFLQADRYVCGSNREYMAHLFAYADKPGFTDKIAGLHRELFEIFCY